MFGSSVPKTITIPYYWRIQKYVHIVFLHRSGFVLCFSDSQAKNSSHEVNCRQFSGDYDVLRQFPFRILIEPIEFEFNESMVEMDEKGTFVKSIFIINETVLPLSVFCLSNLERLYIHQTPLPNGNFSFIKYSFYRKDYFRCYTRCLGKFKKA